MRVWVIAVVVLAGCGRFNFDPLGQSDGGTLTADVSSTMGDGGTNATYAPTIAECIDPGAPDPAYCRANNGNTELPVDQDDSNLHVPFWSYLRFDFDQAIAGREITAVTLRLVISDNPQADGPSSGEIWQVTTFTNASLQTQAPAQLGTAAIAPMQGPVVQLQAVQWSLPTSLIDGSPLCLAVVPTAAAGVSYWNLQGMDPPRLRVDLR